MALQLLWTSHFLELDEVGKRNQLAGALRAHVDVLEIGWRSPVPGHSLQHDVVFLAAVHVGGDDA